MTSTVATIPRTPRQSLSTENLNGSFSRAAGQKGAAGVTRFFIGCAGGAVAFSNNKGP